MDMMDIMDIMDWIAHGILWAMCSGNSKAHGTQYAMYFPLRTTPYTSVPIRTRLRCATPRQAGIAHSIGIALPEVREPHF